MQPFCCFVANHAGNPLLHLARGFIGKGDGNNMIRIQTAFVNQIGHFLGNRMGFTTTGTRQYQLMPVNRAHHLSLLRV